VAGDFDGAPAAVELLEERDAARHVHERLRRDPVRSCGPPVVPAAAHDEDRGGAERKRQQEGAGDQHPSRHHS